MMRSQGQELSNRPLGCRPASRSRKRARITPSDVNLQPSPPVHPVKITDLPTDALHAILELACHGSARAVATAAMVGTDFRRAADRVQSFISLDTSETGRTVPSQWLQNHAAGVKKLRSEGPNQTAIEEFLASGRFPNLRDLTYTNKDAAFIIRANDSLESAALSSDAGVTVVPGKSLRHLVLSGSGNMVVDKAPSDGDNGIVKLVYQRDTLDDADNQPLMSLLESLPNLEELRYCPIWGSPPSITGAVFGRLRVLELKVSGYRDAIQLREPLPALEVLRVSAEEPPYMAKARQISRVCVTREFLEGSPSLRVYDTDPEVFTTIGTPDDLVVEFETTSLERIAMRSRYPQQITLPPTAKFVDLTESDVDQVTFSLQPQIETLILTKSNVRDVDLEWRALRVLVASADTLPKLVHDTLQAEGPPWLDVYLESIEGKRTDFKAVRKLGPIVKNITVQLRTPPTGGKGMYKSERSLEQSLKRSCPRADSISVVYPDDDFPWVDIRKYYFQHHLSA